MRVGRRERGWDSKDEGGEEEGREEGGGSTVLGGAGCQRTKDGEYRSSSIE